MNEVATRARAFIQADRFQEALQTLGAGLASEPQNAELRGLAALCLLELGKHKEAQNEAHHAIGLAPDWAWTHFILAVVLLRTKPKEAEAPIRHAISLHPENPRYFALLGQVLARGARWREVLQATERGLELDPENETCRTLRAQALSFLGKREEARLIATKNVSDNPDSPDTHTHLGWVSLQQGNRQAAIGHFKDALRIHPNHEGARLGLLEALRVAFPPYRFMFAVVNRIAALPRQYQAIPLLVIYGLLRVSAVALNQNRALWPILTPLIAFCGLFYFMRWFGEIITDTILLFHPLGRLALGKSRRSEAWTFLGFGVFGLACMLLSLVRPGLVVGAMMAVASLLLLGLAHNVSSTEKSHKIAYWTVAGVCGLLVLFAALVGALG